MNNKENIDAIAHKISVINEFIENWEKSGCVLAIERKIVKNYLAQIYDDLHAIKPTPVSTETPEKISTEKIEEKPVEEKTVEETKPIYVQPTVVEQKQPEEPREQSEIKFETPKEFKAKPAKTTIAESQQQTTVLGETLQKNQRALYEDFGEKDDVMLTPINDLSKGIGLNDKFLFSKELFGGNAQRFETAINSINSMHSYYEAVNYIHSNFNWKEDNSVAKHFMTLVKRRFM